MDFTSRAFGIFFVAIFCCGVPSVLSCTSGRYGTYGGWKADYSHLDNLDASKSPTLREKIKVVLDEHYGWSNAWKPLSGWSPPKSLGWTAPKSSGWTPPKHHGWGHHHNHHANSYSHTTGHGHGAVSHHHVQHGGHHHGGHHEGEGHHGGHGDHGDHHDGHGYEFAAHNHQKPVVVAHALAAEGKQKFFRTLPKNVYIGNRNRIVTDAQEQQTEQTEDKPKNHMESNEWTRLAKELLEQQDRLDQQSN